MKKRRAEVVAPHGCERTSNEAFVGYADPGVPLKNLCTAVLLRKAGTRCVLFRRTLV